MKVLSQQGTFIGIGVTQTNVDNATVVRLYNSAATTGTVNILDHPNLNVIGSVSIPAGQVIYVQKKSEEYLAGDNTINYTKIAYSPVMQYASWSSSGGGGGGSSLPVTSNLLFYFDAADSSSGDSTWTDKSSNSYVMTAINSPTYDSADGGSWVFDGSNEYFENSSDIGTSSAPSSLTLIAFVKRDGSQSSWTGLVYGRQNDYINANRAHGLHLYSSTENIGFSWNSTWNNNSTLTIPDDEWCMVAVTMESGDSDFYLYKDSGTTTINSTSTLNGSYLDQGTWIWRIARDANEDNREWSGKISIALAYTSKLTQTELTSIWDAYKSRYGY